MTKKALLLFAQSSVQKGLAHPISLSKLLNAADAGVEVEWAYFEDLLYFVDNDSVQLYDARNKCDIEDYSVVYFRYWGAVQGHALAAARICKLKGVPFIDSEALHPGSYNKITQYVSLHEAGVSIPRSLIAHGDLIKKYYQEYNFEFPFILKSKGGTRGQDNHLVKDEKHLFEICEAAPDDTFVMQEFLPNKGDYRIVVIGDEVKLAIYRQASGDTHLNNTSQGGSASLVPLDSLPQELLAESVKAAKFFNREIAGVDMVKSEADGKYYCFEVNRAPQVEHATFEAEKAEVLAEFLASF